MVSIMSGFYCSHCYQGAHFCTSISYHQPWPERTTELLNDAGARHHSYCLGKWRVCQTLSQNSQPVGFLASYSMASLACPEPLDPFLHVVLEFPLHFFSRFLRQSTQHISTISWGPCQCVKSDITAERSHGNKFFLHQLYFCPCCPGSLVIRSHGTFSRLLLGHVGEAVCFLCHTVLFSPQ